MSDINESVEEFEPDEPEQPGCFAVPPNGKKVWVECGDITTSFCQCKPPKQDAQNHRWCGSCNRPIEALPCGVIFRVNGKWTYGDGTVILKSQM